MSEETKAGGESSIAVRNMFARLAVRYDLANRLMSLGRDRFWRRALARRVKIVSPPGRLLDLATGTGDQIVAVKEAFPNMEAVGLDFSSVMMERAEPKFARLAGPKPSLITGNALDLPFGEGEFDSVSISFGLRNIKERARLYAEARRVLKPGGRFLVLEMYHDFSSSLGRITDFYLRRVIPVLGGRLVSREPEAYRYLSDSVRAFPNPREIMAELTEAGFVSVQAKSLTFKSVMLVIAEKNFVSQ